MKRYGFLLLISLFCSATAIEFVYEAGPMAGITQCKIVDSVTNDIIGSLNILNGLLLNTFRSEPFKSMNKTHLSKDIAELIDLANSLDCDLSKTVLLGDLYIAEKHRENGFAKQLVIHTCQDLLNNGAEYIVLIPHPFIIENGIQKSLFGSSDFESKKQQLVKLYKACGFEPVQQAELLYMVKTR